MLTKLINRYIRPYGSLLAGVLVFQLIATAASLSLPSLNARIIDNGVAKGDTDYILRNGAIMLSVSLVQAVSQIIAVYFGAKAAMSFGRDVRGAVDVMLHSQSVLERLNGTGFVSRETAQINTIGPQYTYQVSAKFPRQRNSCNVPREITKTAVINSAAQSHVSHDLRVSIMPIARPSRP